LTSIHGALDKEWRSTATKDFMRKLWCGEMRGALAYVVPSPAALATESIEPASDDYNEGFTHTLLSGLLSRRWGHDYGVPMLQPVSFRHGGGIMSTAYGSQYDPAYNHTAPCIQSASEIDKLNLHPTLDDGLLRDGLDLIRQMVDVTDGQIPIQMWNAGGPLDIASMVVNDTVLLGDLHEYPGHVHRLLESTTELYISFYKAQREIVPEWVPSIADDMWVPDGEGILCGEDWLSVISPQSAIEFEIPYINMISDAFGGVAIHACGNLAPQFEVLKKHVRNLRGIYFNAGECSFRAAVEIFRGTDVVLMPRWALNSPFSFESRLDFAKQILSMKTDDVTVYLIVSDCADPRIGREDNPFLASQRIVDYLSDFCHEACLPTAAQTSIKEVDGSESCITD